VTLISIPEDDGLDWFEAVAALRAELLKNGATLTKDAGIT